VRPVCPGLGTLGEGTGPSFNGNNYAEVRERHSNYTMTTTRRRVAGGRAGGLGKGRERAGKGPGKAGVRGWWGVGAAVQCSAVQCSAVQCSAVRSVQSTVPPTDCRCSGWSRSAHACCWRVPHTRARAQTGTVSGTLYAVGDHVLRAAGRQLREHALRRHQAHGPLRLLQPRPLRPRLRRHAEAVRDGQAGRVHHHQDPAGAVLHGGRRLGGE
jgi:hypothetical protein